MPKFTILFLLAFAAIAEAQSKQITKQEYERAFEMAEKATTYPYRETITFGSYVYFDSSSALNADDGVNILSQVAVTEYSASDRLRITVTTETEKGKKVVRLMQIGSNCYTLVGTRWKKDVESCDVTGLTMRMRPDKEEYFTERIKLDGKDVRMYRYVETSGSGKSEMVFVVDANGRMIKRDDSDRIRTYEYGIRIKPITIPGRSTPAKTRKRQISR